MSVVSVHDHPVRKVRVGEVISDKMDKTIVVRVNRRFRAPKYEKVITAKHKFYVHDEKEEAHVGDQVRIAETRPLSRLKRWRLVEIVVRAKVITPPSLPSEAEVMETKQKTLPVTDAASSPGRVAGGDPSASTPKAAPVEKSAAGKLKRSVAKKKAE